MTGGLINIASYGGSDLYLTGSPQITFFKLVYRRHTNFSIESIYIDIEDELEFDKESEVIVPVIADAVHKGYLEITIPEITIKRSDVGLKTQQASLSQINNSLDNYTKVTDFMKLNTQAHRIANEIITAENIDVLTVIDIALEQFQDTPVDGSIGLNTVNSDIINKFNSLISSTEGLFVKCSSLYVILDDLKTKITSGTTVTKEQFIEILNRAMDYSIKIQGHFFNESIKTKEKLNDDTSENIKFAWVKRLGHVIIDYIDVYIGGEKIDRHYGLWIDIWYELTGNTYQNKIYSEMIGDVPELTDFNKKTKPKYKLYIPLNFWFNRHNGLAFPLIALQYSDLVFNIKLKDISKCCYIERIVDKNNNEIFISLDDIWDDKGYTLDGKIMLDYIFMEKLERKKFAQSSHEYLIDIVQHNSYNDINHDKIKVPLDFRHPCKELVWVIQKDDVNKNTTSFTKTHHTNYGTQLGLNNNLNNPFLKSSQSLNGYSRVDNFSGNYFNFYQTMKHRNTPTNGINNYSFALNPEEHQPSGTCNFSKIPSVIMNFELDKNIFNYKLSDVRHDIVADSSDDKILKTSCTIHIFSVAYNILRIIGGFGGVAFS
jgi:hypothetical protein